MQNYIYDALLNYKIIPSTASSTHYSDIIVWSSEEYEDYAGAWKFNINANYEQRSRTNGAAFVFCTE